MNSFDRNKWNCTREILICTYVDDKEYNHGLTYETLTVIEHNGCRWSVKICGLRFCTTYLLIGIWWIMNGWDHDSQSTIVRRRRSTKSQEWREDENGHVKRNVRASVFIVSIKMHLLSFLASTFASAVLYYYPFGSVVVSVTRVFKSACDLQGCRQQKWTFSTCSNDSWAGCHCSEKSEFNLEIFLSP